MDRELDKTNDEIDSLARVAQEGDRDVRNHLYFICVPLLRRMCARARRFTRSLAGDSGPIGAEDVDQQAFIIFCNVLAAWNPQRMPFTDYLKRAVGWNAYHYVRDSFGKEFKYRKVRLDTDQREGERELEIESQAATRQIRQAEDRAAWREHTDGLNTRWKRLVEMKFREDMTTGEIAVIDGHSRRSVNRDLRAALDAMRARIEEDWEGCG